MKLFPRLRKARAENAILRARNERLQLLLKYQRIVMKERAAESLGMRVALAQMSPPVRRPAAADATVVLDRVVA